MKIPKNLKWVQPLTILIIGGVLQIYSASAEESKIDLLMKGIYEHDKKADFSDDPEGAKQAKKFRKDYEATLKAKKQLEDKRKEVEIIKEAMIISKEKEQKFDKRDMTHELEMAVAKEYGVSQQTAHKMVQSYDPRADKVWNRMVQAEINKNKKEAKRRIEKREKNEFNEHK